MVLSLQSVKNTNNPRLLRRVTELGAGTSRLLGNWGGEGREPFATLTQYQVDVFSKQVGD